MAEIFMNHRAYVDYNLTLKQKHDKVIITPSYLFEQFD